MSDVMTTEMETQQRGQAFQEARRQLEREYNCTMTVVPKWEPGARGTFVLSFEEQVMVGPAPMNGPIPEKQEEKTNETES